MCLIVWIVAIKLENSVMDDRHYACVCCEQACPETFKAPTWSQLRMSLTGAKCAPTPRGNSILPIHSSSTLIFMLIWTARDLLQSMQALKIFSSTHRHKYFFLVRTRLNISPAHMRYTKGRRRNIHSQAAQYMTCDHSCMLNAGLIFAMFKKVWRAVMNEVTSWGEATGCESLDCDPNAEVVGGRPLPNVCRSEANFVVAVLGGVEGRVEVAETLGLLGIGEPGGGGCTAGGGAFFLPPPNERRNDHSDSNCTVSNSLDNGE